jgi:transcriptional regulator with XRE-family HTH domain
MTIGEKIENRLKDLGWQKQEFARMMNVTPSTVSNWLKPAHNFQIFTLFEIEATLGITFFNYNIEPPPADKQG